MAGESPPSEPPRTYWPRLPAAPPAARPMPVGDLFDAIGRLYLRNFALFVAVTGLPIVLASIVTAAGSLWFGSDLLGFTTAARLPDASEIGRLLLAVVVLAVLFVVANLLSTSAAVIAADRLHRGEEPSIGDVYGAVFRRLAAVVAMQLLLVAAFVGLVLLAVAVVTGVALAGFAGSGGGDGGNPGAAVAAALALFVLTLVLIVAVVFLGVRWSLGLQAVLLERRGPASALGRSWRLVAGYGLRVFGLLFLFGLVAAVLGGVGSAFAGSPDPTRPGVETAFALSVLVNAAVQILVLPISQIGMTLVFHDLRRLKDGSAAA